jgi:hypothetical protein
MAISFHPEGCGCSRCTFSPEFKAEMDKFIRREKRKSIIKLFVFGAILIGPIALFVLLATVH